MTEALTQDASMQLLSKLAEGAGLKTGKQTLLEGVYSYFSSDVANWLTPISRTIGGSAAKAMGLNSETGEKLGEDTIRTLVPMGMTLYKASSKFRKNLQAYLGIKDDLSRVLHNNSSMDLGMISMLNSDLEVVKNQRRMISAVMKNDLKNVGVSMLADVPSIIRARLDGLVEKLETNPRKTKAYKKLGTKTEKEAYIEQHTENLASFHENIDGKLSKFSWFDPDGQSDYKQFAMLLNLVKGDKEIDFDKLDTAEERYKLVDAMRKHLFRRTNTTVISSFKGPLNSFLNVKSDKEVRSLTALTMIKSLERYMVKNPSPVTVKLEGASNKEGSLSDYIVDIFKQHQKDCGRDEFSRVALTEIQMAAEQIAEAMVDPNRKLHAQTLAELIDSRKGILKFESGQAHGAKYGQELETVLASALRKPGYSRRTKLTERRFKNTYVAKIEHFKQSWENLSEEEKFMFASLMPDEILAKLESDKKIRHDMRHHVNEFSVDILEDFVQALGQFKQKELREFGLHESHIVHISEAIKQTKKRNSNYVQANRQPLTEILLDAAVLVDQHEQGFVRDILEKRRSKQQNHQEKIQKNQEEMTLAEQFRS